MDRLAPPLVSVIVICYKHGKFIEKCLTSISQQTYKRIELIVVENASPDHSRQTIEKYDHDNPGAITRAIYSDVNDREMGAMLLGFAVATGNHVCFVDGDDWLLPQCVETHVKAFLMSRLSVGVTCVDMHQSSGDEIVVCTGKRLSNFVMSKRGRKTGLTRAENLTGFDFGSTGSAVDLREDDLHYVSPDMAHEWHWSPTSGLCFRREILQILFDPPPVLRDGADGYLVRGACCLSGGIVIDKPMAVYRMHGANLFATYPALENLLQFKFVHNVDLDTNICEAVIYCLRGRMSYLAQSLEFPDIYVQAVNSMALVCLNRKSGDYSSYTVRFLMENEVDIKRLFGPKLFRRWMLKYMRIKDYAIVLAAGLRQGGGKGGHAAP